MKFLTWAELHDRGVLPSRQHTRRLIARGIVPKPYRLGDPERGRLMWLAEDNVWDGYYLLMDNEDWIKS